MAEAITNLLTPKEVGEILGISAETLNTWRVTTEKRRAEREFNNVF